MTVDDTLEERQGTYGDYIDNAGIAQSIKEAMQTTNNWDSLPAIHREALDQIASKIARSINGDPYHKDNFDDIAGYALLVSRHIEDKLTGALDE